MRTWEVFLAATGVLQRIIQTPHGTSTSKMGISKTTIGITGTGLGQYGLSDDLYNIMLKPNLPHISGQGHANRGDRAVRG